MIESTDPVTILLVEDDDGDARAVERSFRKARIANTIVRTLDGIEALETLRGTNGKAMVPSSCIMLVDLNLPRMSGIEFITALRQDSALRQGIVFVLSTSNSDEDRLKAYNLNIAGYIVKQRAGEEFLNLVSLMDIFWKIVEIPKLGKNP